MSSTTYRSHTHRTSRDSAPNCHKYSPGHHEKSRSQPPNNILKRIQLGLRGIFISRQRQRVTNYANDSVDSLAYAQSDDSFEAESMDEDNMAWGMPSTTIKRRNTRRKNKEKHLVPNSPDSTQASCRPW